MGGALAIASSVLVREVDAVVAFYGVPPSDLAEACPSLFSCSGSLWRHG